MKKQHILNLYVCYLNESESKEINANENLLYVCSTDESKAESVIFNACSMDERKSKWVHTSVNTNEVKYAMNKTKNEEYLVIDNSVINTPSYFKLLEYSTSF